MNVFDAARAGEVVFRYIAAEIVTYYSLYTLRAFSYAVGVVVSLYKWFHQLAPLLVPLKYT